jgi:hypothetical protein
VLLRQQTGLLLLVLLQLAGHQGLQSLLQRPCHRSCARCLQHQAVHATLPSASTQVLQLQVQPLLLLPALGLALRSCQAWGCQRFSSPTLLLLLLLRQQQLEGQHNPLAS